MNNQDIESVRDTKSPTHLETRPDKPSTEMLENVTVTLTEEDVR